jgi:RHH-type transcriptional regulator, rel operon repressor / antitoxin RelB
MTETLSIRIDAETKKRLDNAAQRAQRSKSFLAAQAIEDYLNVEEWQQAEIEAGIKELDEGKGIPHESVMALVKSWSKPAKAKARR